MKSKTAILLSFFLLVIFFANSSAEVNQKKFYQKSDFVCEVKMAYEFTIFTLDDKSESVFSDEVKLGTCTIIKDKKTGKKYILTNSHVVAQNLQKVAKVLSGQALFKPILPPALVAVKLISLQIRTKNNPERIINVYPQYLELDLDLAVLKPFDEKILPKLQGVALENKEIAVTDPVMTIGNPKKSEFAFFPGQITEFRKKIISGKEYLIILTTPMADRGSSGSPLLNKNGRLIGIINEVHFEHTLPKTRAIHVKEIKAFLERADKATNSQPTK